MYVCKYVLHTYETLFSKQSNKTQDSDKYEDIYKKVTELKKRGSSNENILKTIKMNNEKKNYLRERRAGGWSHNIVILHCPTVC